MKIAPQVYARGKKLADGEDAISDLPKLRMERPTRRPEPFLNRERGRTRTRQVWDEPAKTLKAGDHGVPEERNTGGREPRPVLLGEEAASSRRSRTTTVPRARDGEDAQLGNAVPVALARSSLRVSHAWRRFLMIACGSFLEPLRHDLPGGACPSPTVLIVASRAGVVDAETREPDVPQRLNCEIIRPPRGDPDGRDDEVAAGESSS